MSNTFTWNDDDEQWHAAQPMAARSQPVNQGLLGPPEAPAPPPAPPPLFSADDLVRIETACGVLDNEIERQQRLWQAAHDIRTGVLPMARQLLEILIPQAKIAADIEDEIVVSQASLAEAVMNHDTALAAMLQARRTAALEEARHQRDLVERHGAAVAQHADLIADAARVTEQLRQEMAQAEQDHETEMTQAKAAHGAEMMRMERERVAVQRSIEEMLATRDRMAALLQGQLQTLGRDGGEYVGSPD